MDVNHHSQPPTGLLTSLLLSSTALPIGAYCYSQGIESAIEAGIVVDEATGALYLQDMLTLSLARFDLPLLMVMMTCVKSQQMDQFRQYAQIYKSSRESKEMLAEVVQMGYSFNEWIQAVGTNALALPADVPLHQNGFLPLYAWLSAQLNQPMIQTVTAYAFSQLENLVLAVVKTVPLGQMAGQRIMWQILPLIDQCAAELNGQLEASEGEINTFLSRIQFSSSLPHLAVLSTQHESLHCRLFRS